MRRTLVFLVVSVAAVVTAVPAAASSAAAAGPLLWQQQSFSLSNGSQGAAILNARDTLTSCDNAPAHRLCEFGRPAVSPDGRLVIVSRHSQAPGFPEPAAG